MDNLKEELDKILASLQHMGNHAGILDSDKVEAKAQIKALVLDLMKDCADWIDGPDNDEIPVFDEEEFKRRLEALQ